MYSEKCERLLSCLVLIGYPPKGLSLYNSDVSLAELGIRSGETLIVEEQPSSTDTISSHVSSHEKELVTKIARRSVWYNRQFCYSINYE